MYNVIIAEDERGSLLTVRTAVSLSGNHVIAEAITGLELIEHCLDTALPADIVIADICMPGMEGPEVARAIAESRPLPVICITGHMGHEIIDKALRDNPYIVGWWTKGKLLNTILIAEHLSRQLHFAIKHFAQVKDVVVERDAVQEKLDVTEERLAERKLIDRAKGILMKNWNCAEETAYRILQSTARDENVRIGQVALRKIKEQQALSKLESKADDT